MGALTDRRTFAATHANGVSVPDDSEVVLIQLDGVLLPTAACRVALQAFVEFNPDAGALFVDLRLRRGGLDGVQLVLDSEPSGAVGGKPWVRAENQCRSLAWVDEPGDLGSVSYCVTVQVNDAGGASLVGDLALIATVF